MVKILATLLGLVAAFLLAVIIPMATTGKLDKASIVTLLGREPEAEIVEEDPASALVQSLNEERTRLTEWETRLKQQEGLLALREGELSSTLTEVKTIQAEISVAMDELDAGQETGMQNVATTLAAMDADNAATDIESMTPEQAALLLPMIDERARGEILDAMKDLQHRSLIHQIMLESKY